MSAEPGSHFVILEQVDELHSAGLCTVPVSVGPVSDHKNFGRFKPKCGCEFAERSCRRFEAPERGTVRNERKPAAIYAQRHHFPFHATIVGEHGCLDAFLFQSVQKTLQTVSGREMTPQGLDHIFHIDSEIPFPRFSGRTSAHFSHSLEEFFIEFFTTPEILAGKFPADAPFRIQQPQPAPT